MRFYKMIDYEDFKKGLFEYFMKKYENKLSEWHAKFSKEFPYNYEGMDNDAYAINFMDWLMFEKTLPEIKINIVDEYISDHPELSFDDKAALLGTRTIINSEFVVISKKGKELILKDRKTSHTYPAVISANIPGLGRNTLIIGRIHPFYNTYRLLGIFVLHNSPMILDHDVMMNAFMDGRIKDAENILVSSNTKLTAVLNKYPSNWVDGICLSLGLSKNGKKNEKAKIIQEHIMSNINDIISALPQKSKDVLHILLENNSFARYSILKEYDDKISYFWESEEPTSDIGILRVKGLLVIGKSVENGRKYTVALIPKELRESIQKQLSPSEAKS